jgi:CMP-N-acetylneuraminic acid synthetase
MKELKVLSIIPARGGSKGLPRKNILDLAGKPLIAWTIEASLKSKYITDTIVSSDDDVILSISKSYGADTLKRPDELATDSSSSESLIFHILKEQEMQNKIYDYVILLQPTSPLRDTEDIDNAFKFLVEQNVTALISIAKYDNKVLKTFVDNDKGFIEGIRNNIYPFQRRQDLPSVYMSNGAIYIIKVDEFMQNKSFWTDKTVKYVMDDIKSIDIDSVEDLIKCEKIIKNV